MKPGSQASEIGGRYRLLRPLTPGSQATTWIAHDGERGDECVVKIYTGAGAAEGTQPGSLLRREVEALLAVRHPHIVRFRDLVLDTGGEFAAVVTEMVEGVALADLLREGPLEDGDALAILVDVTRGLGFLHERGLMHRDLHSRNVVVSGGPGARRAVVVDLGLAVSSRQIHQGLLSGTLGFLAPEAITSGIHDHRSDLYSLGCLLFHMVVGESPARPGELLTELARGGDPFLDIEGRVRARVREPFLPLAERLLSRFPAARFQSAGELLRGVNLRFGKDYPVDEAESRAPILEEPPFVGRLAEKKFLFRAIATSTERRTVALVTGEPGMGRSRLLDAVSRVLELRGRTVLRLRPARIGAVGRNPLEASLHRLFLRLRRGNGTGDGLRLEAPPEDLEEVAALLPDLVIAVDDLDRMDEATASALLDFASRRRGASGALLGVVGVPGGPGDDGSASRWRRLLEARGPVELLPLGPLPPPVGEQFVRGVLPVLNLSTHSVRRIVEAGRGRPEEMLEVLRALLASGRVVCGPGGWVLRSPGKPLPVAAGAAEALAGRVGALPPPLREALAGLALAGGALDGPSFEGLLGSPEGEGEARSALRLWVVVEDDAVTTRLPPEMLLPALLEGGPAGFRERAARRVLSATARNRVLSPLHETRLLLAAGEGSSAFRTAGPALQFLLRRHRLEDATSLAGELLPLLPPGDLPPGAAAFLEEAVRLSLRTRRFEEAAALGARGRAGARTTEELRIFASLQCDVEAASGRAPGEPLRWLAERAEGTREHLQGLLARARADFQGGRTAEARTLLEGLLPRLEGHGDLLTSGLTGYSAVLAQEGRLEESRGPLERALRLARERGDRGAEVRILGNLARKEARSGRLRRALRLAVEGIRALDIQTSDADEASLLLTSIASWEGLGRWRRARLQAERLAALAEEMADSATLAKALRRWGRAEGLLGEPEEALRRFTGSLQAADAAGLPREAEATRVALAQFHLDREERDRAREARDAAIAGETGFHRIPLAVLSLLLDPPSRAEGVLRCRELLADPEIAAWPEERRQVQLLLVNHLAGMGDLQEARDLWSSFLRDARHRGSVDALAQGLSMAALLLVGNSAQAEKGMLRAARLALRLENLLLRSRVLEACGNHLLGLPGGEARARAWLGEAASLLRGASLPPPGGGAAVAGGPFPAWKGQSPTTLAWVLDQTERLNEAENPEEVLEALLDGALRFTGAERGFLVLASGDDFQVTLSRAMEAPTPDPGGRDLSTSLVRRCIASGESILATDAQADARFEEFLSVRDLQLRSVLVVPIRRGTRVLGAFYLDNRFLGGVFTDQSRLALERLAVQAAQAFENVSYRAEVRDLARRLQSRVEKQSKEIEEYRHTVRGVARKTRFEYREVFRGAGAMNETLRLVDRAVESDVPILIEGESGTGKELVAKAIHFHGHLRDRPFVVLNCAAVPESLIESELFGHRKGAFTGAHEDRVGLIERADGGTLFLDEIGELPPAMQPKLLRAIQFGEFTPLGSAERRTSRFRLLAATNRDLRMLVGKREFRQDLYYRIAVFPIRLPPLRERVEDIPDLAALLLKRHAPESRRSPRRLSRGAILKLLRHDWPGNVRELENVVRRASLLAQGDVVEEEDVSLEAVRSQRAEELLLRVQAQLPEGVHPREEAALRRLADGARLTLKDLASLNRCSRSTATRDLRRLVGRGILVRHGRTGAAHYELAPPFRGPDAKSTQD